MGQELIRGRVDPVHVLDDEDERLLLAHAEKHVANRAEGPLLELGARQPVEEFRRRRHAQEMGEQDTPLLPLQAQELVLLGHMTTDLVGGDSLEETETASQQIDDRTVRHGAAVRGAGRLQHLNCFGLDPAQELVQQARLADPRMAHEHRDRALAVEGPAVDFGETA